MNDVIRSVLIAAALSCATGCGGAAEGMQGAATLATAGGGDTQTAQATGGGGNGGHVEAPSADAPANAGSGGALPAVACPAVIRYTTATIRADFALSAADAQHSFQVCRNSECYDGKLSEEGTWSQTDPLAAPLSLRVTDDGGPKYLVLTWSHHPQPEDEIAQDTYQLSFASVPEAAPTFLIDTRVRYDMKVDTVVTVAVPHPEACGSWGEANVDLRATP